MKKIKTVVASVLLAGSSLAMAGTSCDVANLTAAWSVVNNAVVSENGFGTSLDVTPGAAMNGTDCGMEVKTIVTNSAASGGDADKPYIIDDSPNGETRFRAAFYIDANNIQIPAAGTQYRKGKFHVAQCASGECTGGNVTVWRLVNLAASGDPVDVGLEFWVRDNNLPGTDPRLKKRTFAFDINDSGPQRVEYDLDITNGSMRVWLNSDDENSGEVTLPAEFASLDLSDWTAGIKRARLGFIERRTNITEDQTYFLDEYESRRQTFIGM